jgi:uncharacterized PurR-regulated membrane protein YhhQ (DUF165 family)
MNDKNYLMATMVVFDLMALLQLLRLFMGWPVNIGGVEVPMLASVVAFVVASALAVWAFVLLRKQPS